MNLTTQKEIRESIGKKLDMRYGAKKETERKNVAITEDSPISQIVGAMIEKKLDSVSLAGVPGLEVITRKKRESIVAKYMNLPISEITRELRKRENLLAQAEKKMDDMIGAEYEKALKKFSGGSLTESLIESKAKEHVQLFIMGSYAREETDPAAYKAHQQYLQFSEEFSMARIERNAVLVAKQNYIDQNQDIIQEEQRKQRIADLKKSGLLTELGIEEKTEEDQADDTTKLKEIAEKRMKSELEKLENGGKEIMEDNNNE